MMREDEEASDGQEAASAAGEETPRNTLYRKVGKGKRQLTRGRLLLYRVAVVIAWWLVRLLWRTCRITHVAGLEQARQAVRDAKSLIPVFWHQHLLFGGRAVLDLRSAGLKAGFLISPSVDGTAPAMLVEKVGGVAIRGSSTHTGARALRDFYETVVKQQVSPALTPDGPKGPLHEFKPGAIVLAQITGRPILPIAVAASAKYTFPTWDAFELPLPFSRIAIVYGEPVSIRRGMTADALPEMQRLMAGTLIELRRRAETALDSR
jgi:lysophospholipid acyltransferase (LPLAT)-like uncharacterized protein